MSMHVNLRRFNMKKQIKRDEMIGLLGKRRQGKSTLMENIAYEVGFKRAVGLFGTLGAKLGMQKFMDSKSVIEGSVENLKLVIARHKKWMDQNAHITDPKMFETAVFIDDMAFSPPFMRNENLKQLAMNGRHIGMFVVLAVQYFKDMLPGIRGNLDYIFVAKLDDRSSRESLFKAYGGCLGSMANFDRVLEACTQDFGFLVIDLNNKTGKVEDTFFHYRANASLPKWRLGQVTPTSPNITVALTNATDNLNSDGNDESKSNGNESNNEIIHTNTQARPFNSAMSVDHHQNNNNNNNNNSKNQNSKNWNVGQMSQAKSQNEQQFERQENEKEEDVEDRWDEHRSRISPSRRTKIQHSANQFQQAEGAEVLEEERQNRNNSERASHSISPSYYNGKPTKTRHNKFSQEALSERHKSHHQTRASEEGEEEEEKGEEEAGNKNKEEQGHLNNEILIGRNRSTPRKKEESRRQLGREHTLRSSQRETNHDRSRQ